METLKNTTKRQKIKVKKNQYEKEFWAANAYICGIDEVGRGCLAGPVVTAAVMLRPNSISNKIKDSKVMTHEERVKALAWIIKHGYIGIGIVHHRYIDTYNIYQSTLQAMKKAFCAVTAHAPHMPAAIVVDAMPLKLHDTAFGTVPVYSFCKGETLSISIAAASIVAKVYRDTLMNQIATIIPRYGLEQHKGYATPAHKTAVIMHGASLLHRVTFLRTLSSDKDEKNEKQLPLF